MKKKLGLFFCAVLFLLVGSSTQICNVQAQTGSGWTKYPGPVLGLGAAGTWDDAGTMNPSVIKDGDTYKMWYTGYDGSKRRIGYAISADGISWGKPGLIPVLDVGSAGTWDSVSVSAPWVIKDGSTYMMWYVGSDGVKDRIGLATSGDGLAWNKKGYVLSPGAAGQPDDAGVNHPTVIKEGGLGPHGSSYVMWYGADDGTYTTICMAYSGDGKAWSKYDENLDGVTDFVLNTGSPGSWDDQWASEPSVLKSGGVYFMWYTGWDGLTGAGHHRVGLAYSATDGKHWVRYSGNPVLPVGSGTAWDYYTVRGVSVIQDRLDFKMWYTGTSGGTYADRLIGYATNFMRMAGAMGLVEAPTNTVYYIYPDYQGSKPAGTGYAALSDWTALGMVIGMSGNQQYITTDTDTSVVNPSNGQLAVQLKYSAVLCGGWGVSGPTKYYEVTAGASPAYAVVVGSTLYFYSRATGAAISGTAMSLSLVSTNQDMFIIEAFKIPEGRNLIILYGYGWKGSYAAALWFKYGTGTHAFGSEGIPMRDHAYYIFRWTDADEDLFVDLSEISFVASGE